MTVLSDFFCSLFVFNGMERLTGFRNTRQTGDFNREGRPSGFDCLTTVIGHLSDATMMQTGNDRVAKLERPLLNQHCRDRATSLVETCFDDCALGTLLWVGLKLEDFCLQQNHFEQLVYIGVLLGGDVDENGVTTPAFRQQFELRELLHNTIGVGIRLINLVHGNDNRHTGSFGVIDRFLGLWHSAVISGNNQNNDIGDLGAARTHRGKCFVARGVEEGHFAAVQINIVCTDMLSDPAGFTFCDICFTNCIKQAGFTMVNMTHDCDHRRTGFGVLILLAIDFDIRVRQHCFFIKSNVFNFIAEL